MLIAGAGAGREILALREAGYEAKGFECGLPLIRAVYRSFHNGKCYELGIQTVTSRAAYDPESHNNIKNRGLAEVDKRLKETLRSLVFLK